MLGFNNSGWLQSVFEAGIKTLGAESRVKGAELVLRMLQFSLLSPRGLRESFSTYRGPKNHLAPIRCILPPKGEPRATVVVLHGATPMADNHPGILMIARVLAGVGYRVLVPQVPPLKRLKITDESTAWLSGFQNWIDERPAISGRPVAWVAMSFGGTLLLRTTLSETFKSRPPCAIMTYGSFCNLESTYDFLLTGKMMTPEGEEYLEPHEWGKIVVFLNYLSRIDAGYATEAIQRVLRRYEVDDEAGAKRELETLTGKERALCEAIIRSESTPELERLLDLIREVAADDIISLSPTSWGHRVKTKVFVMHGVSDAMVPYTEALALHKTLPDTEIFLSGLARHSTMNTGSNRGLDGLQEIAGMAEFLGRFVEHIDHSHV